tara:strand:- start:5526 stop:6485 length:960 start_codon:yes stop_codon:yes gene_type:complete
MTFKKANDPVGISKQSQEAYDNVSKKDKPSIKGVAGGKQIEPVPQYIASESEKIIDNRDNNQNSGIVFGRDRPRDRLSGYGGRGDTQAASIDIVAGYQGSQATGTTIDGDAVFIDPDFVKDAARIYISQKTDIDANFSLAPGSLGSPGMEGAESTPRSGIALKADGVRIIGREGIKLVTRTDLKNSQGGKVLSIGGIDLIAGNNSEAIQPIPKGENLIDALSTIVTYLDKLSGIVDALATHQQSLNEVVTDHIHISPFQAQPTWVSMPVSAVGKAVAVDIETQVYTSITNFKTNLANYRAKYLKPSGKKYINSRWNNTN